LKARPLLRIRYGGELGEGGLEVFDDLKLVRCPRSLGPTLVTLPSMSLIPIAPFSCDDVGIREVGAVLENFLNSKFKRDPISFAFRLFLP
jgi:hypothetical protein